VISFSTVEYNPVGRLELEPDLSGSDYRSAGRRLSRSRTLDGGVVLDDAGFSDGDRIMEFQFKGVSAADHETLQAMAEDYPLVKVGTEDGLFQGGLEQVRLYNGILYVRFLVSAKLSA